ncbi:MAG TPA: heme lyase CcmF/NrfE family subunit [Aeromonadales bacterium]|nr:heme lyase CcmF/NrfE family subunit [Aeromonadales bacterium]
MIPEIGNLALTFAFGIAVLQFVFPLLGIATNRWRWVLLAKPASYLLFLFISISMLCLTWSFYVNDFSVLYVAQHSNSRLPTIFRLTAVWGGHEGSFLLWVFMLTLWTVAVTFLSNQLPALTRARVLSILGALAAGFISFIIFTSNPFDRIPVDYPLDGQDLNPLLQDFGMVIHPPMLYMGYVGFAVAFSFAIAALLEGHLDALWARWVRPWTLAAWAFLTLGITLGSWWAYYELGWGGWWFWDPVENASFMPWLLGTALIHSLASTEKRGVFKSWTILLAIAAFSFSLLGTFLVRSGVLTSVHSFASDPVRGTYILIFLGVVVSSSLLLFAIKASKVSVSGWFDWLSRELLLLLNNLLLAVATLMILLGTLFPILSELFGWGAISVGAPYFNRYFTILMTPLIFLMGLGSIVNWKHYDFSTLVKNTRAVFAISLLFGLSMIYFESSLPALNQFKMALGIFLFFWVTGLSLQDISRKTRTKNGFQFKRLSASAYGMYLAHIGMAVAVLGVVMSSFLSVEKNVRLGPGQTLTVAGYDFKFKGVETVKGANFQGTQGNFEISRDGDFVALLQPQKRRYFASGQTMTEADIDPSLARDIYVAMGEPLKGSTDWAIRIYVKPFVRCIWFGGLLMMFGGVLALMDRRYRKKIKARIMTKVTLDVSVSTSSETSGD